MDIRQHAIFALKTSRGFIDTVLKEFTTKEQWLFQAAPKANHALWITAHLGLADNHFASKFRPALDSKPEGWSELFWFGSEISDDPSIYPEFGVVRDYFDERRQVLLQMIGDLSDEEIATPAPAKGEQSVIAGAPNMSQLLLFASFHEGIHAGQLTVNHRAMGKSPIRKPQPASAT